VCAVILSNIWGIVTIHELGKYLQRGSKNEKFQYETKVSKGVFNIMGN
jgi:hypothetical protein